MPGRDNNVVYAGHKPTKHVFVFTLPMHEEPKVYEDEVVLRFQNMPNGVPAASTHSATQ